MSLVHLVRSASFYRTKSASAYSIIFSAVNKIEFNIKFLFSSVISKLLNYPRTVLINGYNAEISIESYDNLSNIVAENKRTSGLVFLIQAVLVV